MLKTLAAGCLAAVLAAGVPAVALAAAPVPQVALVEPVEAEPAPPPVPDPLDFTHQKQDPADYGVPGAAAVFAEGDGYSIPAPTRGGRPAGTVPAGLQRFYGQSVEWTSCSGFGVIASECAYVIVPLDYANPTGQTVAVAVARSRATGKKIGSIFVDPGGPGFSGLGFAGAASFRALRPNFDIVGIAPRGVAPSVPMIRCQSNANWDAGRQGSDLLTGAQANRLLLYRTDECYRNTGALFGIDSAAFIASVGTANVVKDLDVTRSALGDAKINYVGFSYGTSIGYEYARQFPQNIRSMIIDGVVDPFENNATESAKYKQYYVAQGQSGSVSQIAGFQKTFEQFLGFCAANLKPCALGDSGDVPTMLAAYQKLARAAWGATTYSTSDKRPLSFGDLNQGTIEAMYSQDSWEQLNDGLLELTRTPRAADSMMALADSYAARNADGTYGLPLAAFPTISCTDKGTPEGANDPAQLAAFTKAYFAAAPFADPGNDPDGKARGREPSYDWCTYYRTTDTLPAGVTLTAMPNILVISTTYDPATPYDHGVVAAAGMGATLLTVAGANHTSFSDSVCANQIGSQYLRTLRVPSTLTGETGVQTKDIHSRVITGDECTVTDQFRARAKLTASPVRAGTSGGGVTTVTATGLVQGADYTISVTGAAPETVTANATGTATAKVRLTARSGRAPAATIKPADPATNDPTISAGTRVAVRANHAPTAPAASATTPAGVAVQVAIRSTDADRDPIRLTVATSPAGKTVVTGHVIKFAPARGFKGRAVLRYTAADDHQGRTIGTITITVR